MCHPSLLTSLKHLCNFPALRNPFIISHCLWRFKSDLSHVLILLSFIPFCVCVQNNYKRDFSSIDNWFKVHFLFVCNVSDGEYKTWSVLYCFCTGSQCCPAEPALPSEDIFLEVFLMWSNIKDKGFQTTLCLLKPTHLSLVIAQMSKCFRVH